MNRLLKSIISVNQSSEEIWNGQVNVLETNLKKDIAKNLKVHFFQVTSDKFKPSVRREYKKTKKRSILTLFEDQNNWLQTMSSSEEVSNVSFLFRYANCTMLSIAWKNTDLCTFLFIDCITVNFDIY